jgi:hypothetical protein
LYTSCVLGLCLHPSTLFDMIKLLIKKKNSRITQEVALVLIAFSLGLRFNPFGCKQFLRASLAAKLEYYPIRVEGAICMGPKPI